MKLEFASAAPILYKESCPFCKQKRGLSFVKWSYPNWSGDHNMNLTVCGQDSAEYLECAWCKSLFKVPKELRTNKGADYEKIYMENEEKP